MNKTVTYKTKGTCSREIVIVLDENGKIVEATFVGGCHGNTQGISSLVVGMDAKEAITRLRGIDCRGRGTSCPDQLAKILKTL